METLLYDLRYAVRTLTRTPVFTALAVITIAIGTGANATVFTFVNALLMRPAPAVRNPGSLVAIYTSDFSSGAYGESSYPDYLSLRTDTTVFSGIAAERSDAPALVRVNDAAQRVRVSSVSAQYFEVLGLEAAEGRLLGPADTETAASPAAVLGYDLWQRVAGSDRFVPGTTITVSGRTYTVVGLVPRRFQGLDLGRATEMWTPLVPPADSPDERGNRWLTVVARLRAGSTLADAQTQVATVASRLAQAYPATNLGTLQAPHLPRSMIALRHTRLPPQFRGQVAMLSAVLMAAVGLVLVLACANVANLLLSRATARRREMAIRRALGATRTRLVRQLMSESTVLGLAGGITGLIASLWTTDVLPSFFPTEQARMLDASLDARAFAFVLAVSFSSAIAFGLLPALQAIRPSAAAALKGDAGRISDSRGGAAVRRLLVVGEITIAVVLLVGAALLVQTVRNMLRADPGFRTREAVVATVELPASDFTAAQGQTYYELLLDSIKRAPGVVDAAFVRTLPLSGGARRGFKVEGYQPRAGEDMELNYNIVGDRYFETMQIELVAGRLLDRRDGLNAARVVVVNEALAHRYFGGRAVDRMLIDSSDTSLRVVGVVRSGPYRSVQEGSVPLVYYPLAQLYTPRMTLVARTAADARSMVETIRDQIARVNRGVPVFRAMTLSSHLAEATAGDRLTASLVSFCGGMALLLAMIGVYGVISYAVARRTREIGVRVALGAQPRQIAKLVVAEGLGITAAGVILGSVAAWIAARLLSSLLYGVGASDARTYAAVCAALATIALLAALGPARRALRIEPTVVLRQE